MENKPCMVDFLHDLRHIPIFRQLIPQEAGIGWPIPVRKSGTVYVTVPFYGFEYNKEQQQTKLFPPFATLTFNWENKLPVEYVNLRFRNPWPEGPWQEQAGVFPHPAVAHLSVGQYQQKREELLAMYDEMLATLAQGGTFSAEWTTAFSTLLRMLMEPALESFYRALAPKFFERFLPPVGR